MDTSDGDAAATSGLTSYFTSKIGGLRGTYGKNAQFTKTHGPAELPER